MTIKETKKQPSIGRLPKKLLTVFLPESLSGIHQKPHRSIHTEFAGIDTHIIAARGTPIPICIEIVIVGTAAVRLFDKRTGRILFQII